jgi:hypothetical protein
VSRHTQGRCTLLYLDTDGGVGLSQILLQGRIVNSNKVP